MRTSIWRAVLRLGAATAVVWLVLPPAAAQAADPAIAIVDEKPAVRVTPYWKDTQSGDSCDTPAHGWMPFVGERLFDHRVTLLVRNDSADDRTLTLELVTRDGEVQPLAICNGDSLGAGESRVVVARATSLDEPALGAAVVVAASTASSQLTATAVVDATVLPHREKYWMALAIAVVAGVAVALLGMRNCWAGLGKPILTDQGWKLGDSWATTITAVGALLTTTLGASGLLEEIAPTANGPRLVAMGLAFGGLALLAPIATTAVADFALTATDDKKPDVKVAQMKPTGWSLLAGGTLTVVGIYGQLTLLALLVSELDVDEGTTWVAAVLIFAAMALIAVYALRTWEALTVLDRTEGDLPPNRTVSPGL